MCQNECSWNFAALPFCFHPQITKSIWVSTFTISQETKELWKSLLLYSSSCVLLHIVSTVFASTSSVMSMFWDICYLIFAYLRPRPSFLCFCHRSYWATCSMSVLYVEQVCVASLTEGHIHFSLADSSHRPQWLSLKDALSLPEGAILPTSLLW